MVLKQDKGRGVAILDTAKYNEKYMALLHTERFQVTTDPTAATDKKIQKVLRKLKTKFSGRNTKDYTKQAQHQLDYRVQARYTS